MPPRRISLVIFINAFLERIAKETAVVQRLNHSTDAVNLPTFVNLHQYFRQTTSFGHSNGGVFRDPRHLRGAAFKAGKGQP
jgi:hypothetical protein